MTGIKRSCEPEGMIVRMSRTADCDDHAAMESFFHRLKGECIDDQSFHTPLVVCCRWLMRGAGAQE